MLLAVLARERHARCGPRPVATNLGLATPVAARTVCSAIAPQTSGWAVQAWFSMGRPLVEIYLAHQIQMNAMRPSGPQKTINNVDFDFAGTLIQQL